MIVSELIEILQQHPADAEVRLATQQHYPLQAYLYGVATDLDVERYCEECDANPAELVCPECEHENPAPPDEASIIYLVEGSQPRDTPYASSVLWDNAETGW